MLKPATPAHRELARIICRQNMAQLPTRLVVNPRYEFYESHIDPSGSQVRILYSQ